MSSAYRVSIDSKDARNFLLELRKQTRVEALDRIVGDVSKTVESDIIDRTPVGFFGQLKREWRVEKNAPGIRTIKNTRRASNGGLIMLFLEEGTGRFSSGFIYPRVKKRLYVPLNKRGAGGWNPSLVYGRDYILRKRVRGIKPRRIVAKYRPRARQILLKAVTDYTRTIVRNN